MAGRTPIWQWILGIVLLVLVAVIGGGWWAWRKTAELMQARIQANPAVEANVGTIRELVIDAEAVARQGEPGRLIFKVVGSKASGVLAFEVDTAQANAHLIKRGTLTLTDGTVIPLVPDSVFNPPPPLAAPKPDRATPDTTAAPARVPGS